MSALSPFMYCDERGIPVARVFRGKDGTDRSIEFLSEGRWRARALSTLGDDELDRASAPYRLLEAQRRNSHLLYLTDTEEEVDALDRLGVVATTTLAGFGGWTSAQLGYLSERDLVLLTSSAEASWNSAQQLSRRLVDVARTVRILRLPCSSSESVSQWVRSSATQAQLRELVEASSPIALSGPEAGPVSNVPGDGSIQASSAGVPSRARADVARSLGVFSLRELTERPEVLAPPEAVLECLAWSQCVSLLVAPPKAGKSTLVGQAVAALSHGREFLGKPTAQRQTLWLAIDEHYGVTVRRLIHFGAHLDWVSVTPNKLNVLDDFVRALRCCERPLVVTDTLAEWWPALLEENDSGGVRSFLSPMIQAVREENGSLLLLHHSTKTEGHYRGSGQIGASVDVIIDMADVGEGRRRLRGRGREAQVNEVLSFDGHTYSKGSRALPREELARQLLQESGPLSKTELAKRLGGRQTDTFRILNRLVAEGVLEEREGKLDISAA